MTEEKIMNFAFELAIKNIDIKELFNSKVVKLWLKNYAFLKEILKNEF